MKRIILAFLTALLMLSNVNTAKASHVLGGEITWRCLSNGKYIFYMNIYRDCTGIGWPFNTATLEIFGSPLPRGANNQFVSQILLKPDSNKWTTNRNGDTSPQCNPGSPTGNLSCASQDEGTVQAFYYESDPITLKGVPPANGWRFVFTPPCCRPNVTNLSTGGTPIYRAFMYADANNTNVNPCIDSSPEFKALPVSMICRNYTFTYNHTAIDYDLDSIVYAWDRTYNTPASNPSPVVYAGGYNFNNPTPNRAFNNQNIPATLDPITGIIRLAVYSGGPTPKDYLTVVRADSYRDGVVIASVFREIPFVLFDCPPLANGPGGVGGGQNNPPDIFIDGVPADDTIANIVAGQTVRIPFQATDYDYGGQQNGGLQKVTIVPDGFMFSTDLISKNTCIIPSVAPCATLQNQAPVLNSNVSPPRREISNFAGVATEFVWETRCHHIRTAGTGVPGQQFGLYNFVMRTLDNHCPIPGINYPTITVRVRDPLPLTKPIMKGASVGLDGRLTYQWVPPLDSAMSFNRYLSEFSSPNDGNPPSLFQTLNANVQNYKQQRRNGAFQVYVNGANNQPNILQKRPGKDWYFRMHTESGCAGNVASDKSDPVRVIEVNATPSGQAPFPLRSEVQLNWNRAKPLFSPSYPYFVYESNTHYYIWENDSIEFGGQYIGGEAIESNWYLRGDTNATTYKLNTNVCNSRVGFRIESRDTVITWTQGSRMRPGDTLDTLTYRTFSVIDTTLMIDRGYLAPPRLDSIVVMSDGSVYFRIDKANAGTAGRFNIYDNGTTPPTQVASFKVETDSFLYTGINANNLVGNFTIESEDQCDPTRTSQSGNYNTMLLSGQLLQPACSVKYQLDWNSPTGFTANVKRFEIYVDSANTGFRLNKVISNGTATSTVVDGLQKATPYLFKVVAIDETGAVNSSAEHFYQSPTNLRSFEIVPAPELYCTYVESDGSVTLTFTKKPRDSTLNGVGYEFDSRREGGNWQLFAGSPSVVYRADSTVTITGINAMDNEYDFRARTISGCDGATPSDYGNVISSIKLSAMADPADRNKSVVLNWNDNQIGNSEDYGVYRTDDLGGNSPYFSADSVARTNDEGYIDLANGDICNGVNGYYVTMYNRYDDGDPPKFCINRSSYDTAKVEDIHRPDYQLIDFVTVNPQTEELEIYWSEKGDEDIAFLKFFHNKGAPGSNSLDSLGFVSWYSNPQRFVIPLSQLDARDTAYYITVQAIDGCENIDSGNVNLYDYHKNMDIDVQWNQCDSTLDINWTGYHYFNEGGDDVTYTVYLDSLGNNTFVEIPISETKDSTYRHKVYQGDMNYRFYVKAVNSTNNLASNSNIDGDSAFYQDEPLYGYLHYATVKPNKAVEVQMLKDTTVRQGGYAIYRGTQQDMRSMQRIGRVNVDNELFESPTFKYTDFTAHTDARSYFYKIITENQCGGNVDTSNFGRSIYLEVYADNEALTNTLKWNEYTEWDSTVAYYNIYRGFNGGEPDDLLAVVAPSEGEFNQYVDDVYDNTFVKGRYCYKVEAVQGPINANFNGIINSATSVSNEGCATQKPLFYVPNAFAPDGVNKVFMPKGQFFDFSLYEMAIYNRWGEQLFITRDINVGWDGTQNGEIVPLGSYVYTIRFVDADGKEHKRKGTVTVIR